MTLPIKRSHPLRVFIGSDHVFLIQFSVIAADGGLKVISVHVCRSSTLKIV